MATRLRPLNAPQTCALCKPAEYLRWDVAANCPNTRLTAIAVIITMEPQRRLPSPWNRRDR
jgi:hypothetical protein